MKFFGREVSDTGCEILLKVGSRYADPLHPGHFTSWRDGQIGQIRPLGYHTGKQVGYCCTLLQFPNINYIDIGGRIEEDWKKMPATLTPWDKINHTTNEDGKYEWELIQGTEFIRKRKTRDWFLDFKDLENQKLITKSERENIYNHDNKTIITIPQAHNLEALLKHEDQNARLDSKKLLRYASITSGVHSIGSGLDYDDLTAFELAIGATLTGDLTGEHNNEETVISSGIDFNLDTSTYLLKLTAQPGDEHNGGAYGNGARIAFGVSDHILIDELVANTLDNFEISNLALDIRGLNNKGFGGEDGGQTLCKINRLLIYGDTDSFQGVYLGKGANNVLVTNCIIYGIGEIAGEGGIVCKGLYVANLWNLYNNTIINCYNGIENMEIDVDPTITVTNNLIQASRNASFVDAGGGFTTGGYNVTEDANGPDAAYDNTDVHTNSVFQNYAADDFRLDSAGDATNLAILDDGADLSGTFTDDIQGQTRSIWYIGASEIVEVGGETFYQNTGQGAVVIAGSLATVVTFVKAIGDHAMTIVGTLVKKTSKGVGDGQVSPTGILSKKTFKDVGGGSVTSIGALAVTLLFTQAVGGASMSIIGSLATQFIAKVEGVAKFLRRRKTFYKQ